MDSFYIEYVYNCGAVQKSRSQTVRIDYNPPTYVNPDSVSVIGKKVIIGWNSSPSADTKGYVIYRSTSSTNVPIDTVFGKASTFFIDSVNADPLSSSQDYKLAVLDSCDNVSRLGNDHATIFLNGSQDTCARAVLLSWSAYKGWPADSYAVYYSVDNGVSFHHGGSVTGSATGYSFKAIEGKGTYLFFVRAYKVGNPNYSSSSNVLKIITTFSATANNISLDLVTDLSGGIRLQWSALSVRNIAGFIIEHSKDSQVYSVLGIVYTYAIFGTDYNYQDTVDDPGKKTYFRIRGIDRCGNKFGISNVAINIALQVSQSPDGRFLQWNKYKGWKHKVKAYYVYRSVTKNDSSSWIKIATLSGDSDNYVDLDSLDYFDNNGICYQIVAIGVDSSNAVPAISYSNIFCTFGPPIARMPNAFIVNGANGFFRPITLYVDVPRCTMKIYNRWGEEIFLTADISTGWDGKQDGKPVPEGVYFYNLEVYGVDRTFKAVKGTFTVLY